MKLTVLIARACLGSVIVQLNQKRQKNHHFFACVIDPGRVKCLPTHLTSEPSLCTDRSQHLIRTFKNAREIRAVTSHIAPKSERQRSLAYFFRLVNALISNNSVNFNISVRFASNNNNELGKRRMKSELKRQIGLIESKALVGVRRSVPIASSNAMFGARTGTRHKRTLKVEFTHPPHPAFQSTTLYLRKHFAAFDSPFQMFKCFLFKALRERIKM